MEKIKLLLLLLFILLAFGTPVRLFSQDTLKQSGISPVLKFSADLPDSIQSAPKQANWLPDDLKSHASWGYFWMNDEGLFGMDSTITYRFANNGAHEVHTKIRGRYSDTPEPPAMRVSTGVTGGSIKAYPIELDTVLPPNNQVGIIPNWRAARPGDTIYLALAVRNRFDVTKSGYLKLLQPQREFQYIQEEFPASTVRFGAISQQTVYDENGRLTGTLNTWRIDALPAGQTQTLFIEIVATTAARDSMSYTFEADVQWDDELASPVVGASTLFNIGPDQIKGGGSPVYNPVYFNQETSTTIAVNRARDPNALTVSPNIVAPDVSAPAHLLTYRVDVENTGSVPVSNLDVTVLFDKRIDLSAGSFSGVFDAHFPNAPTISTFTELNKVLLRFEHVNLAPSQFGGNEYSTGHFFFSAKTKPGINLVQGNEITSRAVIVLWEIVPEDTLATAPAVVYVQKPRRMCYGSLLGLKIFNYLPNPDSARNTGAALTLQCPLYRPAGNSLGSYTLQKKPKWFWQFELGLGTSTFTGLDDSARVKTGYVHLTPAQIRYTGGVIPNFTSFGFSAGYSLDLVYQAKINGQKATLKSGLAGHLEQELAASVDLFNLAAVPGIAIGAGYKYRWNNLFQNQIHYSFPFVYAQINFIHFHQRAIQVWNKLYQW